MRKHGFYEIERIDQVVISRLYASWDIVTAQSYFQAMKRAVVQIYDKPWVHLSNIVGWELAPPDVFVAAQKYNEWMIANGLRYKLVVSHSKMQVNLVKNMVPSSKFLDVPIFDTEENAMPWLIEHGFMQSVPQLQNHSLV